MVILKDNVLHISLQMVSSLNFFFAFRTEAAELLANIARLQALEDAHFIVENFVSNGNTFLESFLRSDTKGRKYTIA